MWQLVSTIYAGRRAILVYLAVPGRPELARIPVDWKRHACCTLSLMRPSALLERS